MYESGYSAIIIRRKLGFPENIIRKSVNPLSMRIQRYMSQCAVASRRRAEEMIKQGRVSVNDQVVTAMGTTVEGGDVVKVDGRVIRPIREKTTIIYNKPAGLVCSVSDEKGRQTVVDAVKSLGQRVYPVGRLDMWTEGLLLMTNDGELALLMTHPRYHVTKTYVATVKSKISDRAIAKLRSGVMLEDGMTRPARVRRLPPAEDGRHRIQLQITEGRNRQVRRMLETVGAPVHHLVRTHLGPLSLQELRVGQWRKLTEEETAVLKRYNEQSRW